MVGKNTCKLQNEKGIKSPLKKKIRRIAISNLKYCLNSNDGRVHRKNTKIRDHHL